METQTFFLYLLDILLPAKVFAELAVQLKAPAMIPEYLKTESRRG